MTTLTAHPVPPPAADLHGEIGRKLRQVWRRQRLAVHLRGACLGVLWSIGLILADLLIDWLFLLPGYGRLLLLLVNVGALGYVVWRCWLSRLAPFDPVRVALQVERDHPQLQSLLVSYLQLHEDNGSTGASPALVAAMRRQAIQAARPINFAEIVSLRDLRRLAIFCSACVLIFGAMSVNWSNILQTLLLRLINPAATLTYPTRTRIDSITGELTVRQGDPVAIAAKASGLVPIHAELMVRSVDAQTWDRLNLEVNEDATVRYPIDKATASFDYRLKIGDALTPIYRVRVVPPPGILRSAVRIEPPAYTGLEPTEVDRLHLEVPQGSTLKWRLKVDRPLRAARLQWTDGEPLAMQLDPEGTTATAQIVAQTPMHYELAWTDREFGYDYADGVRYAIRVKPDLPPQVTLLQPAQDEPATRRVELTLVYEARDDYGLRDATLVFSLNEADEQRRPLEPLQGPSRSGRIVWRPIDDLPGLAEGDTVAFAIEVRDNRDAASGEAGIGRSAFRRIHIVSAAAYEQHIAARQQELLHLLDELRREEEAADQQVDELLNRVQP